MIEPGLCSHCSIPRLRTAFLGLASSLYSGPGVWLDPTAYACGRGYDPNAEYERPPARVRSKASDSSAFDGLRNQRTLARWHGSLLKCGKLLQFFRDASGKTVYPENPTGIKGIKLAGVGFSGDVRDVALIPGILSRISKVGRSSGGGPRLATPDRCASTTDSQPKLKSADRHFWVGLRAWKSALMIVQPETVTSWHHDRFKRYWWKLSQAKQPGRPQTVPRSES